MMSPGEDGRMMIHAVVRNRRSERVLDALQSLGEDVGYHLIEAGELAAVVSAGPRAAARSVITAVSWLGCSGEAASFRFPSA
jgi:hypothetical protein